MAAVIWTMVGAAAALVETVNVTVSCPAAATTEGGTAATDGSLLNNRTVVEVASGIRLTVPCVDAPPRTEDADSDNEEIMPAADAALGRPNSTTIVHMAATTTERRMAPPQSIVQTGEPVHRPIRGWSANGSPAAHRRAPLPLRPLPDLAARLDNQFADGAKDHPPRSPEPEGSGRQSVSIRHRACRLPHRPCDASAVTKQLAEARESRALRTYLASSDAGERQVVVADSTGGGGSCAGLNDEQGPECCGHLLLSSTANHSRLRQVGFHRACMASPLSRRLVGAQSSRG